MISEQYTPDEPIVAIATALVPALAVVRTSGKILLNLCQNASRPKALNDAAEANTLFMETDKNGIDI